MSDPTKFLQERVLNGVLCYRKSPGQAWSAYTGEELTQKIEQIQTAAQQEIGTALTERREVHDKAIQDAVHKERLRLVEIVKSEPEAGPLSEESQRKQLDAINRVDLVNLVIRCTKHTIVSRMETPCKSNN